MNEEARQNSTWHTFGFGNLAIAGPFYPNCVVALTNGTTVARTLIGFSSRLRYYPGTGRATILKPR